MEELEADYTSGALHPGDLKPALSKALNTILQPVRTHFETNAEAKELLKKVSWKTPIMMTCCGCVGCRPFQPALPLLSSGHRFVATRSPSESAHHVCSFVDSMRTHVVFLMTMRATETRWSGL